MKIKEELASNFCIFLSVFLCLIFESCAETAQHKKTGKKCPPGYTEGLYGDCVKRFIPKRKGCPEPDIRFGGYEVLANGRMVKSGTLSITVQ